MNHREKSTYLVYHHGRDPAKLRLGNLVVFPQTPEDSDPYVFPFSPSDLRGWTGNPQCVESLKIKIRDSNEAQLSGNVSPVAQGGVRRLKGSSLIINGEKASRFQIDQPTDFLNREILSRSDAREWLHSRVTVARRIYYMNQLKPGKARHPDIWLVTGIQLMSNVTVRSESQSQTNIHAGVEIPPPELTSGITAILASDSGIGVKGEQVHDAESSIEYEHTDERVWAAQFRRLKLKFRMEKQTSPSAIGNVSLRDLLDLGQLGIRKPLKQDVDPMLYVDGVHEDDARVLRDCMADEELRVKKLFWSSTRKRALLIGGCTDKLKGVENDLQAISDLLLNQQFIIEFCYGEEATRNGILHAWARFIQETKAGDTVVVYYSGHGGVSEEDASHKQHRIQYILPADIYQTTKSDFRGILDVELSHLITGITNKTPNVTVILDCCHPERMARDSGVRADNVLSRDHLESHMEKLRDTGFLSSSLYREGNPHSVRVVAAESDRPAYERSDGDKTMGNLTRLLVQEIKTAGNSMIPWAVLLENIRRKMENSGIDQRPQVEGPKMRSLFSLNQADYWGQLDIDSYTGKGKTKLRGGLLAEVREGDQYAVMPPRSLSIDPKRQIALATVQSARPETSTITLEFKEGHSTIPMDSKAFPLHRYRPGYGLAISGAQEEMQRLLSSRLETARFTHQHDPDKDGPSPFAIVECHNGKLILSYPKKTSVFKYPMANESEYAEAVNNAIYQLDRVARADQLLSLGPRKNHELDVSCVSIEVGTVCDGDTEAFIGRGKYSIEEGTPIYMKILNNGEQKLFASVFLVTAMGSIECLSMGSPSGAELFPGGKEPYYPYQDAYDADEVKGFSFDWPRPIPRVGSLDEAFTVIITNKKVDLGFLSTAYTKEVIARELNKSNLGNVSRSSKALRFGIKRIDYEFVPKT
ncbi:hypothetical protein H9Q70_011059 [Fusarium xylarioides]|nr:hypothetical protein H9Q70_011059 [Fusarium xylarioides]KAG5777176.1 hypothetical protein H9Q73_009151 [Fusarium xylarioides]